MTKQEDPAEQPTAPSHISPFERIRQVAQDGGEYWLARDLATVLDYSQWRNFEQAIERAIRAARNSGQDPTDHFAEVSKMITAGRRTDGAGFRDLSRPWVYEPVRWTARTEYPPARAAQARPAHPRPHGGDRAGGEPVSRDPDGREAQARENRHERGCECGTSK